MRDAILEILYEIRPDIDFEKETNLVTGGLLASFDIIAIVDALSTEFDVTIRPKDLIAENFDSIDGLENTI